MNRVAVRIPLVVAALLLPWHASTAAPAAARSNFLLILADDLGYSDLGY